MSGPAHQLPAASDALYLLKMHILYYIANNLYIYRVRIKSKSFNTKTRTKATFGVILLQILILFDGSNTSYNGAEFNDADSEYIC